MITFKKGSPLTILQSSIKLCDGIVTILTSILPHITVNSNDNVTWYNYYVSFY